MEIDYEEMIKQIREKVDVMLLELLARLGGMNDELLHFFTVLIDKGCPAMAIVDAFMELAEEAKDNDRP